MIEVQDACYGKIKAYKNVFIGTCFFIRRNTYHNNYFEGIQFVKFITYHYLTKYVYGFFFHIYASDTIFLMQLCLISHSDYKKVQE